MSVLGPLSTTPAGLKLFMESVLSTEPWLHDPLVDPIPWRKEQEESTKKLALEKKLTFAVFGHDGMCTVHPPIQRAMDELVAKLEKSGHKVMEWKPPGHKKLAEICNKAWNYDAGADAKRAFALSGEVPKPNILMAAETPEATATDIMRNQIAKRDAQKEYMEYWNSTKELTGTGRPVDAVISPLAPFVAARPNKYSYYNYSSFVNVLDYSSVVVPVTRVDKGIDKPYSDFQPIDETDRITQESCKLERTTRCWSRLLTAA